jgi:outer membrane protein assembly factor BamB
VNRETGVRAWKVKTGARIDGSAIVFDDAVVFGSRDGRVYALAPKDGEEIWRLDLGEGFDTDPAFANGRLVIGGTGGNLFCIKGE